MSAEAHNELEYNHNTRIICVSYKDNFSAGKKSMNDLHISFQYKIFAAGTKRLASYRVNDYVIICANENKKRWAFLARITECMDEPLSEWHDQGGQLWNYNFRIQPITGITEITPRSSTRNAIDHIMDQAGLNKNNLFNSRFCSNKLISGIALIFKQGLFMS